MSKQADDRFTIDKGPGNGYSVFYKSGNGCYFYDVGYNDNGCRFYSRTKRIPKEIYDKEKEKSQNDDNR